MKMQNAFRIENWKVALGRCISISAACHYLWVLYLERCRLRSLAAAHATLRAKAHEDAVVSFRLMFHVWPDFYTLRTLTPHCTPKRPMIWGLAASIPGLQKTNPGYQCRSADACPNLYGIRLHFTGSCWRAVNVPPNLWQSPPRDGRARTGCLCRWPYNHQAGAQS